MSQIDATWVASAVLRPESTHLEHKESFPDLTNGDGKAEFVRDVLSMANATSPGQNGAIIYGVRDRRHGGGIAGLSVCPPEETVQQVLAAYTTPVPKVNVSYHDLGTAKVAVVQVCWADSHPFAASRDIPPRLSRSETYTRRGPTNAALPVTELVAMIRDKAGRVGPAVHDPLVAGFLQEPRMGTPHLLVYRIENRGNEPVAGITTILDFRSFHWPDRCCRQCNLVNARLDPGEARDVEVDLGQLPMADGHNTLKGSHDTRSHCMDVVLRVKYRSDDGYIREFAVEAAIDS